MTEMEEILIAKEVRDYISEQLLLKHIYLLETGNLLLNSKETDQKLYDEILIPEKDIDEKVKARGYSDDQIGPCLISLCVENFLELSSTDNKKTMYVRVLEKGMSAISNFYFLRELENRKRDLFQERISTSTIETNKNIRRSNRVIVGASISTGVFALAAFVISLLDFTGSEKLKPELIQLRKALQMQEQQLQQIGLSLAEINHSIQTVNHASSRN